MRNDEVHAAASRRGGAAAAATTTTGASHHQRLSQKALDRKNNKPIMEKKRRARINHCLNQLKALILETDNERSRHSKLEKADILEMTVRYLQTLRAYHLHLQQINHQLTSGHQPSHQLHTLQPNFHSPQQPIQAQQQQAAVVAAAAAAATSQLLHLQMPQQPNLSQQQQQHQISAFHHHNIKQHQHQLNQVSPLNQISPTWRPW